MAGRLHKRRLHQKCPRCQGSGEIIAPAQVVETVFALDCYKDGAGRKEVAETLFDSTGIQVDLNAVTNRLNKLVSLGFAVKLNEKVGRDTIYRIVRGNVDANTR